MATNTEVKAANLPPMLMSEDVAQLLRIKTTTARALMRQGKIPGAVKVGKRLYVSQKNLYEYLGLETE